MNDPPSEALVIVADPDHYEAVIGELNRRLGVTQMLPPRLALARHADAGSKLPDIPGVAIYLDHVPSSALAGLSSIEQLFAKAWEARHEPKDRPGDGLPWDAPGHEPPDAS